MSNSQEFGQDDDNQSKPEKLRDHEKAQANRIKELEAKEEAADKAIRRLAFVDAGVDTSTLVAQDFVTAYNGELTTEAIQEAAIARKLIADPTTNPQHVADRAALGRIGKAAADSGKNPPLVDIAKEASEAKTPAELMEVRRKRAQLAQNS